MSSSKHKDKGKKKVNVGDIRNMQTMIQGFDIAGLNYQSMSMLITPRLMAKQPFLKATLFDHAEHDYGLC